MVEVTTATLVTAPGGAVTVRVKLLLCPLARMPRLQLTTPLLFNPPPEALTKVTVAGKLSVTTTPLALEGPKLVTEIVYTRLLLASTLAAAVLPIPTSATGVTLVMTGRVILFVGLGSPVGVLTLAVLVNERCV